MRLQVFDAALDHTGQVEQTARQRQLLFRKQTKIDFFKFLGKSETGLSGLAKYAGQPGVRVLDIEHRIFRRTPLGQVDIEIKMGIALAEKEEEARHIGARTPVNVFTALLDALFDLINKLVQRHVGRFAGRHLDLLAAAGQRHELVDDNADRTGVMPQGAHGSGYALVFRDMVGAENIDYQVEAALQFVDVVGDVGSAVGRLPL